MTVFAKKNILGRKKNMLFLVYEHNTLYSTMYEYICNIIDLVMIIIIIQLFTSSFSPYYNIYYNTLDSVPKLMMYLLG